MNPPRGARHVERDPDTGEVLAFELPEIIDDDFFEFDFDDLIDDIGDEEEDSYGEDAT